MEKISGTLNEVGSMQNRVIDVVQIGGTTLRKMKSMPHVWEMLVPGREATLYIYRHLFFRPVMLGMKYPDTGVKQLITPAECRGSCIQVFVIWGLGLTFGALIVGGMITSMLGFNPESSGGVFALIGFGAAVYLTVRLWLDYQAASGLAALRRFLEDRIEPGREGLVPGDSSLRVGRARQESVQFSLLDDALLREHRFEGHQPFAGDGRFLGDGLDHMEHPVELRRLEIARSWRRLERLRHEGARRAPTRYQRMLPSAWSRISSKASPTANPAPCSAAFTSAAANSSQKGSLLWSRSQP